MTHVLFQVLAHPDAVNRWSEYGMAVGAVAVLFGVSVVARHRWSR